MCFRDLDRCTAASVSVSCSLCSFSSSGTTLFTKEIASFDFLGGKDGMLTWNTLLVIKIIYYYVVWRKYGELDFKRTRLILSRRIFSSIFDKRATPLYLGVSWGSFPYTS